MFQIARNTTPAAAAALLTNGSLRTMPRPILATVHLDALRHNLNQARVRAPDAQLWAVVKANAYGHGIERCFEGLRSADGFALLDLEEAQRIRALDWRGQVLLLEGVFEPRDLELCSRLGLWHTVHCTEQLDWLAAHKTQAPHRVFLKLNSGMNRLGFTPMAFRAAWARLNALPQVEEISLMTHFSDADGPRGITHQVAACAMQAVRCGAKGCPLWPPTGCAKALPCTGAPPITPKTRRAPGVCAPP